jgi:hypothetical protein
MTTQIIDEIEETTQRVIAKKPHLEWDTAREIATLALLNRRLKGYDDAAFKAALADFGQSTLETLDDLFNAPRLFLEYLDRKAQA